jgi:hypothetical protein
MIQAYSLGCLKPEEIRQIRKFGKNDPDFNYKELGKYQNLTALLPIALPLEIPDNKVKEKVARKLYRLKEDTKNRKDLPFPDTDSFYKSKDIAKEILSRSSTADSTSEKYARVTGQERSSVTGDIRKSKELEELKITVSPRHKSFTVKSLMIFIGISFLVGLAGGYILFYENNDSLLKQVNSLQGQIQEMNSELIMHNGLLTLLEKKDLRILPLSGTEMYPDGFGKIYVHNSSNRAYLYMSGIPVLRGEGTYQLWITNGTAVYPAGTFNPKVSSDYYYFTFPRMETSRNLRILLTEEPEGGSKKPGKKIYLTSQF